MNQLFWTLIATVVLGSLLSLRRPRPDPMAQHYYDAETDSYYDAEGVAVPRSEVKS